MCLAALQSASMPEVYSHNITCCYCPVLQVQSKRISVINALQVLRLDAQMQKLAEELKHENSLLVFGRGYNYATALEAALKVGCCYACHAARTSQPPGIALVTALSESAHTLSQKTAT